MAESINVQIADALTEQQLRDVRVESQLRREAWAILALLEADILAALKLTDPTQYALLARRRREVETVMREEIDPLITARYAQLAAMLDEAMMRLATHEAGVVQQVVNDATEEETITALPSERRLRAGVVHGLFPSAAQPTDLSTTGRNWWQRQAVGFALRLSDSLMVSVSLEESLTHLTQRVRGTSEQGFQDGLMAKARDDAARLVRTQTTNAVSEARVAVAERNAAQLMLVHQSILDSRTSTICLSRSGLKFTSDTHEPIGHSIPYLSGVPYHPNCVIGSTRVFATGIQGTSQREYVGEVITLRTQRGYELTCTPNHPILTNQGWVAAYKLDIGSNLLCCGMEEWPIHLVDMYGYNRPSCMQDIVQAFEQAFGMSSVPVPITSEDFHGDGQGSKVAIIRANGLLRSGDDSQFEQPGMNLCFLRCHASMALQCLGFLLKCRKRDVLAPTRPVGDDRLVLSLLWRHMSPFFLFLLASSSQSDVVFEQATFDDRIRNVIASAKSIKGHTMSVGSNNVLIRQNLAMGFDSNTHSSESLDESSATEAMLLSQTANTLPGQICCDKVIHRKVSRFCGHVYNLQTANGWYVSNNIITHNCRSSMLTVLKNGGPVTDESLSAWLKRRGPAFQDEVLGPTRARMFRAGSLSPRALLDASTGKPLTLEELGA